MSTSINSDEYITVPEAARLRGVARQWMLKLAKRGVAGEPNGIPAIRIGRDYLIRRTDVEKFQPNTVGWKKGRPRKKQNTK